MESRLRQTILQSLIETYKHQNRDKSNEMVRKINRAILFEHLYSGLNLVLLTLIISATGLLLFGLSTGRLLMIITALGLAVGLVTIELIWLRAGLKDERRRDKALATVLQAKVPFRLDAIRDRRLKARLVKALQYWVRIDDLSRPMAHPTWQDQFLATQQNVTRWLQTIYDLACRVDYIRFDLAGRPEWRNLSLTIQNYQQKLAAETDQKQRRRLEGMLTHHLQQLQSFQALQNDLDQALAQLDQTITALGTVHSQQLVLAHATRQGRQSRQVEIDVQEEIQRLQDLAEAVAEVYLKVHPAR